MVHVKKCPHPLGRGKPTCEFYKEGRPQIYCYGWIDMETEEPHAICKQCADHVDKAQYDLEKSKGNVLEVAEA